MSIIGVDEAGRGALAGPVAVGAAFIPKHFDWSLISDVRDSKQLSPERRNSVFNRVKELKKEHIIDFRVAMVGAAIIDTVGITRAVRIATARALYRLPYTPEEVRVLLDGLLVAPAVYTSQETIIRGDQTEPAISLASIMAKVTRDRYMIRIANMHPEYDFDRHKGYGTLQHRRCIERYGIGDMHRAYFCKSLTKVSFA